MRPSLIRSTILGGVMAAGLVLAHDLGETDKKAIAKAFKKPGYSPYAGRGRALAIPHDEFAGNAT